jgi:hypothetical protein
VSWGVPIVGRERPTFFRAYSYYNYRVCGTKREGHFT